MSVSRIHSLVLEGRITPAQGASLLELRRLLQRSWWQRFCDRFLTPLGL